MSDAATCPDCRTAHGELPPVLAIAGQPLDRFDCLRLTVERMRPVVEAARKHAANSRLVYDRAEVPEEDQATWGDRLAVLDQAVIAAIDAYDGKAGPP